MTQRFLRTLLCKLASDDKQYEAALATGLKCSQQQMTWCVETSAEKCRQGK